VVDIKPGQIEQAGKPGDDRHDVKSLEPEHENSLRG
jgi:hypothetical protein